MNINFDTYFLEYVKTDDIFNDILNFLNSHSQHKTIKHLLNVSEKGTEFAEKYGENIYKIKLAAYFHDISVIIPNENKIEYAEHYNIKILDEERIFPMIIHQKISREIAERIFGLKDIEILNAIECHTTLKAFPTRLDMILFIADKIKWDQEGDPPYLEEIETGLKNSLENGVKNFIKYWTDNKHPLKVVHPQLIEAYKYFENK